MLLGHCHVGPPGHFRPLMEGAAEDAGTIEQLGRYLGELGFDRAVAFAPFRNWYDGDPNAWLIEAARGDARIVPWVTVNASGRAAVETLQEWVPRGARGVKFHPPIIQVAVNDPALADFYSLAEFWRVPVLFHAGPHGWRLDAYRPLKLDEVAQRHPKLPIIVEHLGGQGLVRETYAVMHNNPNVYGGLATCLPADATWHVAEAEIGDLIRAFGTERFLFGADFPYNAVETNRKAVAVLRGLGLPAADLSLILSGNLERLVEGVSL